MNTLPSTEERIWAILSHISALALGMGILLPIIGWAEQRQKSNYVAFQCLQALGYQSLGYTIWLLAYLVVFVALLIIVVFMSVQAELRGTTFSPTSGAMIFYIGIFGFLALYMLLPIAGAVACGLGKDFRYPILGNRLANYLNYRQPTESEWLVEEHEDRWVAAMGHFSVIILLWGLLAPFATWITRGKLSPFLKFQSIQTIVYQAIVTLAYFGAMALLFSGFSIFTATVALGKSSETGSLLGLSILVIFSLIAILILLALPLFHILGQWAGYRILKGDDYRYPVVGKLTERWIGRESNLDTEMQKGESI